MGYSGAPVAARWAASSAMPAGGAAAAQPAARTASAPASASRRQRSALPLRPGLVVLTAYGLPSRPFAPRVPCLVPRRRSWLSRDRQSSCQSPGRPPRRRERRQNPARSAGVAAPAWRAPPANPPGAPDFWGANLPIAPEAGRRPSPARRRRLAGAPRLGSGAQPLVEARDHHGGDRRPAPLAERALELGGGAHAQSHPAHGADERHGVVADGAVARLVPAGRGRDRPREPGGLQHHHHDGQGAAEARLQLVQAEE